MRGEAAEQVVDDLGMVAAAIDVDAPHVKAMKERHGEPWWPFRLRLRWAPEDAEEAKVYQAHWRKVHKCVHCQFPGEYLVGCCRAIDHISEIAAGA